LPQELVSSLAPAMSFFLAALSSRAAPHSASAVTCACRPSLRQLTCTYTARALDAASTHRRDVAHASDTSRTLHPLACSHAELGEHRACICLPVHTLDSSPCTMHTRYLHVHTHPAQPAKRTLAWPALPAHRKRACPQARWRNVLRPGGAHSHARC